MSLLPLAIVLALVGAVALGAAITRPAPPTLETTVAAARRHARRTARAALAAGVLAGLATAVISPSYPGSLGVSILRVPVVFAITHTAVLALGEFTWPRPVGQLRRARLVRRGLLDAAPRRLLVPAGTALVVVAPTLAAGTLIAEPDGRTLTWTTVVPLTMDVITQSHSPFPGWFYGRPAAIGLVAIVVVTLAALRVVATRPAVVTDDDRIEEALRRASVHRVLRAVTAVLLLETGGLVLISGLAVPDIAPTPMRLLGGTLAVLGVLGMVAAAVIVCLRAPDVPADTATVPVG